MSDIYREQILDLYKHPLNKGKLPSPTHQFHKSNQSCGDDIIVYLLVEDTIVKEVSWEGSGCAICIASTSLLTEELKGKSTEEIMQLTHEDITKLLNIELGPVRIKCATLSLIATQKAIGE